jgi:hypothetical protein
MGRNKMTPQQESNIAITTGVLIFVVVFTALFAFYSAASYYKKESIRLKEYAVDKGYAEMVQLEDGSEGFKWKE